MRATLRRLQSLGQNPVGRNATLKLASEVVGRLASFLLLLWAARSLGESLFGLYNYGLALGFVLAQIADFGLQVLIAREVAVGGKRSRPLLHAALQLKLLLSLPVLLLLLLATRQPAVLLLGVTLLLNTYLEFAAYVFRGEQKLALEVRLLTGARVLIAVAGLVVLWQTASVALLALSQFTATLLMLLYALRLLQQAGWLQQLQLLQWQPHSRRLLRQAAPLGVAVFLSIAGSRLALLLLQRQIDLAAVGAYSAAQRLIEPTFIIPASLLAAVFPAYAARLVDDRRAAQRLAVRTTVLLALAGVALALTVWLCAGWLIQLLYGEGYGESVRVLQLLATAGSIAFVNYSLTHLLIARGRQAVIGLFNLLTLLQHLILSLILIPRLGVAGPAYSTIAAEGLLLLCCLIALALLAPRLTDVTTSHAEPADSAGLSTSL